MKKFAAFAVSCVLALSASFAAAQSPGKIRIVSPRDGGYVAMGDVTVVVATENVVLDAEHHWHLYVDGELRSMVGEGATSWTTPITKSGPHEIKVTLSDPQHDDLASATIYVTSAPATPKESPFNLPRMAPVMGALAVSTAALILISLRMTRRAHT